MTSPTPAPPHPLSSPLAQWWQASAGKRLIWGGVLFCLLMSTGCCGCLRDILDFGIVSSGLSRSTRSLACDNKARVIDRIRWFEMVRHWERQMQAHALSKRLGDSTGPLFSQCDANCLDANLQNKPSCCDCYRVDFCNGFIDLSCFTKPTGQTDGLLAGELKMDVGTTELTEGEAYFEWNRICHPPAKRDDPNVDGVCLEGSSSYRAELDDAANPRRLDLLWVTRLWVQEGKDVQKLRLDGALGMGFLERRSITQQPTQRKAIFFEESSFLYSKFTLNTPIPTNASAPLHILKTNGKVTILGTQGQYECCFKVDPTTGARTSSCTRYSDKQRLCPSEPDACQ